MINSASPVAYELAPSSSPTPAVIPHPVAWVPAGCAASGRSLAAGPRGPRHNDAPVWPWPPPPAHWSGTPARPPTPDPWSPECPPGGRRGRTTAPSF